MLASSIVIATINKGSYNPENIVIVIDLYFHATVRIINPQKYTQSRHLFCGLRLRRFFVI
jgi:hypothetical protein